MAQMPSGDQAVEELRQRIGRLSRLFDRLLDQIAASHHISRADWTALAVIIRGQNCCTPTELAEALELTSGTVSTRIKRLTEAGLIETNSGAADARSRPVKATTDGQELWQVATSARTTYEARLIRTAVDEAELAALNSQLSVVLDVLEEHLGPSSRHDLPRTAGADG
ncbi:MAG: MarR family winged helix-turn-helix transcriptional regulator [Mycobacterium sp.]